MGRFFFFENEKYYEIIVFKIDGFVVGKDILIMK